MSEELRECPFCKNRAEHYSFAWRKHTVRCRYCLADCGEHDTPERAAFVWNTRPAEDALKAEVEELRYIVEQFKQWYNDNGCPKKHNPDFPCSAEQECKSDPETEGILTREIVGKRNMNTAAGLSITAGSSGRKSNQPHRRKGERMKCPKCGSDNIVLLMVYRNDFRNKYKCEKCGNEFIDPPFTVFDKITASPEVLAAELVTLDCDGWWAYVGIGKRESYLTREEAISATVAALKEVER